MGEIKMTAPSQPHSETSVKAAELIEPSVGSLQAKILSGLREESYLGQTDEEIALAWELNPSTSRPRRIELVNAGLVVDSGRTRKTISGRAATVWIAVNKPRQQELL